MLEKKKNFKRPQLRNKRKNYLFFLFVEGVGDRRIAFGRDD